MAIISHVVFRWFFLMMYLIYYKNDMRWSPRLGWHKRHRVRVQGNLPWNTFLCAHFLYPPTPRTIIKFKDSFLYALDRTEAILLPAIHALTGVGTLPFFLSKTAALCFLHWKPAIQTQFTALLFSEVCKVQLYTWEVQLGSSGFVFLFLLRKLTFWIKKNPWNSVAKGCCSMPVLKFSFTLTCLLYSGIWKCGEEHTGMLPEITINVP